MLMAATEFMKRAFTKGPSNSLQSVLSVVDDYAFDRRHRLDTRSEVAINDLDISDEDKQHADKYKPTRDRYFRKIMAKLNLPLEGVFVDVGCGKGRVLLLAAEHGFDQVVGLEISHALCEIAKRNVATFQESTPTASSIKVVCTNILDYEMKDSETVFFLYSPFDHAVTKSFLAMIRQSLKDHPRDLWLIIDEFRFPELLEDDELLKKTHVYEYGSAIFHVYQHQS